MRDLRDGEHEHEIEEQLDEADAMMVVAVPLSQKSAVLTHRRTIA